MRIERLSCVFLLIFLLASCSGCALEARQHGGIVIMSYNLMNLFDPVDQGGEYREFSVAGGTWNDRLYRLRLKALSSAVSAAVPGGPDVLVVQEAENARVLADLGAALGGYGCVVRAPEEDALVACGILSRYPVVSARAHRATPPEDGAASVPRFLLEVELDVQGHRLAIFAAHWKSKLGGAAETEADRRSAASLAGAIIGERLARDPDLAIVLAGDLNESHDEYLRVGRAYPTALMSPAAGTGDWLQISGDATTVLKAAGVHATASGGPVLYCPWEDAGGYSYVHGGIEERIDNIFLSARALSGPFFRFESFSAIPPDFLVDGDGNPLGWNGRSCSGYSDHLPIRIELSLSE